MLLLCVFFLSDVYKQSTDRVFIFVELIKIIHSFLASNRMHLIKSTEIKTDLTVDKTLSN